MPAYNESGFLATAVSDVVAGLRATGDRFEVLVVENGSRDDTAAVADRLAAEHAEVRALHLPDPDYGAALRAGLLAAAGEVVVNFDVDYYDLGFVVRARDRLAAPDRPAIVVGSKRAVGAEDRRARGRRLVTAVFAGVLRLGFGLTVSDTHGMKALRRTAVEPLARRCRSGTDLFDTELVLRVERAGLPAVELPVVVEERRPSRSPIWRRVPRTLRGLLRLRVLAWRDPTLRRSPKSRGSG
jgi:glycosyltransferase involved in cell wall biosynthesis